MTLPMRSLLFALTLAIPLAMPLGAHAQQHLRDREIHDADTLAWWHTTEALSNDGMEGRDTGSAAYQRAAQYVANRKNILISGGTSSGKTTLAKIKLIY